MTIKYLLLFVLFGVAWWALYSIGILANMGGGRPFAWYTILLTIIVLGIFIRGCQKINRGR